MSTDLPTIVERPFLEIADDLLTALVGGVVNEPLPFDLKVGTYPLARPANVVRSITGLLNATHHTFLQGVDFEFSEGDNAIVWVPGAAHPDDETTFFADYIPTDARSPLTDVNVGSVTRTLGEAIAREIALLYQEVNEAYRAGFVGTATGTSLELVVAILGLQRKGGDVAQGLVTFFRTAGSTGTITIPALTVVATADGAKRFETTDQRTLQRGQDRIDVPVRAAQDLPGDAGVAGPGEIVELGAPIEGVDRITNIDATALAAEPESDEQLRTRARATLRALSTGTTAAIVRAIEDVGAHVTEVHDPNDPPERRIDPGRVAMLITTTPARFASVAGAAHQARAAGVELDLLARFVHLTLRITGRVDPGMPAAGKEKVVGEILAAVETYLGSLGSGTPAQGQGLLDVIGGVAGLHEVRIVDVIPAREDLAAAAPETLVDDLAAAAAGAPPGDTAALRAALAAVVAGADDAGTPQRLIDRALVLGPSGARATDDEIEAGLFTVSATVDGQPWWIVPASDADDIALEAGG